MNLLESETKCQDYRKGTTNSVMGHPLSLPMDSGPIMVTMLATISSTGYSIQKKKNFYLKNRLFISSQIYLFVLLIWDGAISLVCTGCCVGYNGLLLV